MNTILAPQPVTAAGAVVEPCLAARNLHWWDGCNERPVDPRRAERDAMRKARLAAAYNQGGLTKVLELAGGEGARDSHAWELAMTAWFGPTGVHLSYLGLNGRPTEECRRIFPNVDQRMRSAEAALLRYIGA